MQKLDAQTLRAVGRQHAAGPCACALRPCRNWESFTEDRWPRDQMTLLGTLRDPAVYEPTTAEHHPQGTRYASEDAPVAVDFFPYNLSEVHACSRCSKVLLRYTEYGGYYVDHRVRELDPDRVM
ncbi:MAG: hypothetical protein JWP47_3029 [Polaromonas sp.]|jgi:hypothetical protein|nr:hypothetical protein [Polaromonas sp.]